MTHLEDTLALEFPNLYEASKELYKIIGYDTFEEFVSDCVKIRVQAYIEGGADSGSKQDGTLERFREKYDTTH